VWIPADETRDHVLVEIRFDGELASVERRIAETVHAVVGDDFQRDEIASGTGEDRIRAVDFHGFILLPW
jgi:hypothetical protein